MIKLFLIGCVALLGSTAAFAQKVEVTAETGFRPPTKSRAFIFWEAATDTTLLTPVATLNITGIGPDADIEMLFERLKLKAQMSGANAFKPVAFTAEPRKMSLSLKTYYASPDAIQANTANQEKNVVYVFGNISESGKAAFFQLNDNRQEIPAGTFYRHIFEEGQQVKISKGSLAGTTAVLKAQKDEPALFLSLSGFKATPAVIGGASSMVFSAGGLTPLNKSLGRLLVTLLKPNNPVQSD